MILVIEVVDIHLVCEPLLPLRISFSHFSVFFSTGFSPFTRVFFFRFSRFPPFFSSLFFFRDVRLRRGEVCKRQNMDIAHGGTDKSHEQVIDICVFGLVIDYHCCH